LRDRGVEAAVGLQSLGESHRLAQAVHDGYLSVMETGDDQMKTVGTQINGRQQTGPTPHDC
jgi:hypothetical protein